MNIACVTNYDATTANAYGVRSYYMLQALSKEVESIEYIDTSKNIKKYSFISLMISAKYRLYYKFLKKIYVHGRDALVLKEYANQIAKKLSTTNTNIVFSPLSPASQPIAYLECKQPIVIWTDTTFAGVMNFYPGYNHSDMCKETIKDAIANERSALERCSLAIYSSEWAAKKAIEYYQISPSKVKVVPYGANLICNRDFNDIKNIVESRQANRCKLLFLGEDWYRKGGDIALQIAEELNKSGLNAELNVVGCIPPDEINNALPSFVRCFGYINKSTQEGAEKINKLLCESHFLILPTRADCTPNVIPEANSFGIPCITTDVGGIPTIIKNNVNGQTFSKEASVKEYCKYIFELFSNYNQYKSLSLSAFNEYQNRLNWRINTQNVKNLMMKLL